MNMNESLPEPAVIQLDARQVAEIRHAFYYKAHCNHGTVGHNMLILIADLASALGFVLAADQQRVLLVKGAQPGRLLVPPDHVTIYQVGEEAEDG